MEVNVKWWSVIMVVVIILIAILIVDGNTSVKSIEGCKTIRIRPYTTEYFTWKGIVELNTAGKYQPSCL